MAFGIMLHHLHDGGTHSESQGSITQEKFDQFLSCLKGNFDVLSCNEFTRCFCSNTLKENQISITFDDALKCQYDLALPVLRHHGLQAYFFVYDNAFKGEPDKLEFFRDFRTRNFSCMNDFYEKFFCILEKTIPHSSEALLNMPESYLAEYPFYSYLDRKFRYARDHVLSIFQYEQIMINMMSEESYDFVEAKSRLFMSIDDLTELSMDGHDIGLHSSSHPTRIDLLSDSDQAREYKSCYSFIHSVTGRKPSSMSHPVGRYNKYTFEVLKDLGIDIGFRDNMSPVSVSNQFTVPREDHVNLIKSFGI